MVQILTIEQEIERHRATDDSSASHVCEHLAAQPDLRLGDEGAEPVYVKRHARTGRTWFLCRSCVEFAIHAEAWTAVRQ